MGSGSQVEEMSSAALQYHKVLKENRKLYNLVQDLKGANNGLLYTIVLFGFGISQSCSNKVYLQEIFEFSAELDPLSVMEQEM